MRICTQRLAGTTAVPEVIYNVAVETETPHVRVAGEAASTASVNPEHVDEVLVAKSKLFTLNVPVAYPEGKVTDIP
jgi:hypothetical protein